MIPAIKDRRTTRWSHMMGVTPDARSGARQAAEAGAARAAPRMNRSDRWSCDPLKRQRHLNYSKLGVIVRHYAENLYGGRGSPLHAGTPTDQFIASGDCAGRTSSAPRVARAAGRVTSVASAPVVSPHLLVTVGGVRPGGSRADARHLLRDSHRLARCSSPSRSALGGGCPRADFPTYFARGYGVVDFFYIPDRRTLIVV